MARFWPGRCGACGFRNSDARTGAGRRANGFGLQDRSAIPADRTQDHAVDRLVAQYHCRPGDRAGIYQRLCPARQHGALLEQLMADGPVRAAQMDGFAEIRPPHGRSAPVRGLGGGGGASGR